MRRSRALIHRFASVRTPPRARVALRSRCVRAPILPLSRPCCSALLYSALACAALLWPVLLCAALFCFALLLPPVVSRCLPLLLQPPFYGRLRMSRTAVVLLAWACDIVVVLLCEGGCVWFVRRWLCFCVYAFL